MKEKKKEKKKISKKHQKEFFLLGKTPTSKANAPGAMISPSLLNLNLFY